MPKPNGPHIRSLRQQSGMKVGALAKQADIAPVTAANIENGHNTASIEVLYRIARVLDVPVEELIAADAAEADVPARSA
jgi:transcriptional regulator with XRE-family HTH domain